MIICSIHLYLYIICIFIIYIYIYTYLIDSSTRQFRQLSETKLLQGNCHIALLERAASIFGTWESTRWENSHFFNIKMEDDFWRFSPYKMGKMRFHDFYVNVFRSVRFWNEHVFCSIIFFPGGFVSKHSNHETVRRTPRHILSFLPLLFVGCHATSESDCQHTGKRHQCLLHACVPRTWSA